MAFVWNEDGEKEYMAKLVKKLTKGDRSKVWHSIYSHFHPASRHDNSIFAIGGKWTHLYGCEGGTSETCLEEEEMKARYAPVLFFPPMVFRQATLINFQTLCGRYVSMSARGQGVLELYAGVGTISLHLGDVASFISASDVNPSNKECFQRSVTGLPKRYHSKFVYEGLCERYGSQIIS